MKKWKMLNSEKASKQGVSIEDNILIINNSAGRNYKEKIQQLKDEGIIDEIVEIQEKYHYVISPKPNKKSKRRKRH